VAVVVASGTISDGQQPPGSIGGDSTAELLRRARKDDAVKAIVLRVDSPGGSAMASEVIREECALARKQGKTVVVSMGGVAASGGYWISTAADEIWASATTITGSIGIFGMLPTFQKPLAKYLGMRVDGVGTTWLYDGYRPDMELKPRVAALIQQLIERGYQDFLKRVSQARNIPVEKVDEIAQGRVWSGADAHRLGLVDKLGGLPEAIASAAQRAKLGKDYQVKYFEKELPFMEQLVKDLLVTAMLTFAPKQASKGSQSPAGKLLRSLSVQLDSLAQLNDPHGIYAYCFCEID